MFQLVTAVIKIHLPGFQERQTKLLELGEVVCRMAIAGAEAYSNSSNYMPQGQVSGRSQGSRRRQETRGVPAGFNSAGRQLFEGPNGGIFYVNDGADRVYQH